jgi:hypothetical protein
METEPADSQATQHVSRELHELSEQTYQQLLRGNYKMIDIDIPMSLVRADLNFTTETRIIWFQLHNHMRNNAERGLFKSPSLSELARHSGYTVAGVGYMINTLENAGYVKTKKTKGTASTVFEFVANPIQIIEENQPIQGAA